MRWLALIILATGCAAPVGTVLPDRAGDRTEQRAPKRIAAAVMGEPNVLEGARIPGTDAFQQLVHVGFANVDDKGLLQPRLAEAVPTLENGLWRVFPDGRMETTWTVRPNVTWHDGAPFSTEDLLFTAAVARDRELPIARDLAYDLVTSIEASAPRTVTLRWGSPFVNAHAMFSQARGRSLPLPKHLLERAFTEDKPEFLEHSYWTQGFVGTGPFRVREWVRGSHAVLDADAQYVLGRPRIDTIEVKFIPDPNTLVANVLAGAVDITLGRALSLEPSLQIRDQWREGHMDLRLISWIVIYPQFINPSPSTIADVRFRKALMHALDRQRMAEALNAGLVPVAHTFLGPGEPAYRDVEASIVRYDYDARETAQMLSGLGYAREPDGSYRDGAGQRLAVELRTSGELDIHHKAIAAVADDWQRIGISVDQVVMPPQRMRDNEYRATFPGFTLFRQGNDIDSLTRLHSSRTPLPENGYRVTGNHSRYMSPQFDALLDRYFATIPKRERDTVLAQIVRHTTEQLTLMGLFYDTETTMISNRLLNASARHQGSTQAWNAEEWDVRS